MEFQFGDRTWDYLIQAQDPKSKDPYIVLAGVNSEYSERRALALFAKNGDIPVAVWKIKNTTPNNAGSI